MDESHQCFRRENRVAHPAAPGGTGRLAALFLFGAALASVAPMAGAQSSFPNHPIIFVSPFPPGGGNDLISRSVAMPMTKDLGQNVVVENRPGAETVVGMSSVARAAPDGYTVILTSSTFAINATLNPKLPYTQKDFEPVAFLGSTPYIVTVNATSPIKTMNDLIAMARSKPGQVFHAGASLASKLGLELLNLQSKVQITHVNYKGAGLAATDLVADRVTFMMATPPTVLNFIKSGKLRAIAVSSLAPSSLAPGQPTVADVLKMPGFEVGTWYGILAPAHTPADIVRRLNVAANKATSDPVARERMESQGIDVAGSTPEQFKTYIQTETEKWGKVIRFANVKPESE